MSGRLCVNFKSIYTLNRMISRSKSSAVSRFHVSNVNDRLHMTSCMLPAVKLTTLGSRYLGSANSTESVSEWRSLAKHVIDTTDNEIFDELSDEFRVIPDFISEAEGKSLYEEVQPHLRKLRYEQDHWDDAILNYRETERRKWSSDNAVVLQRVRETAFPPGTPHMEFVHVLDLAEEGEIKPHVDSVRFCGCTIAGLSLLSDCVMRLALDKDRDRYADILVKQHSLYIMRGKSRYDYAHAILGNEASKFRNQPVPKGRRISVICRNEPDPDLEDT